MLTVKVFAVGDHAHAGEGRPLPNSFGAESAELVKMLLEKAGYTKNLTWECRIDKMLHCSHDSRPIRIVGYKPYGVSMRVKPKDNSTVDQLCTLLIPSGSGYSAKNLFEQLKANEKSISRHWRKEQKENRMAGEPQTVNSPLLNIPLPPPLPAPALIEEEPVPEPVEQPVAAVEEDVPEFKDLTALSKDKDKLKFVLRHIHMLSQDNSIKSKDEFIVLLRGQCKWEKFLVRICSRAVNELVKNEYVMECIGDRNKIIGYTLTQKGLGTIGISGPPKSKPAVLAPPVPPPLDFAKLLITARSKAQELADAGARIESNRARESLLREEIRKMEQEIMQLRRNKKVAQVIANSKEAYETLQNLLGLIMPLPMEGMRTDTTQGSPVK
jgi:hypothetical protein